MKNATKALTKQLKKNDQRTALYNVLSDGLEISVDECRAAGIAKPTAVVTQRRDEGFQIYLNPRKTSAGPVKKYRLNN